MVSILGEPAAPVGLRPPATTPPLTEASLRQFDEAMPDASLPDELLYTSPARDLLEALSAVVASLKAIDLEAATRRKGWLSRLVGADLEARAGFELACRTVDRKMAGACQAAEATSDAITQMHQILTGLEADRRKLDHIIAVARRILDAARTTADPDLFARMERRVANAIALQAANDLAMAQLKISIAHAGRLHDRFVDVDKLLFPVWQRHALSVASSPVGDAEVQALQTLHERFIAGAHAPEEVINS